MKREAKFTTIFKKWLHSHSFVPSAGAYEIKVTINKRVPFDAVKPHQIEALLAVKHGKFILKIPDAGWQNPFDVFLMAGQSAYVVVAFLEPRKKVQTYIIDIDMFIEMKNNCEEFGVKSMSQDLLMNHSVESPERCQYHSI